jgi:heptosyltransferase-2
LGDAIMTFPAVRNLKRAMGDSPLTIATPQKLEAVWKLCPFVDRIIPLPAPKNLMAVVAGLKGDTFSGAVLLPNSLRVAAEAKLTRIPRIAGVAGHARRWLLSDVIPDLPFAWQTQHQVHGYVHLMKYLGASGDTAFPELKKPDTTGKAEAIGLCPGAEYGPAKRWPAERFAEVGQALSEQWKLPVRIFGAAGDQAVAAAIAEKIPGAENLAGQTTMEELIAHLAACRLVLSNDSGAMHLASVLGVRTLGIFGSTEQLRTGPLGPRTTVIREHVPCSPCFLRECPIDFACMQGVTVERVTASVLTQLD